MRACGLDLRVYEEIEEQGLDILFGAPLSDAQTADADDKEVRATPSPKWRRCKGHGGNQGRQEGRRKDVVLWPS